MFTGLKNLLRPHIRGRQRSGHYPVLLPHHVLQEASIQTLGGPPRPMDRRMIAALRLCDGTRTLNDIARTSRVSATRLARLHEQGTIVLWRVPIPATPAAWPLDGIDGTRLKIIVSPHLDDAPLSLGGMMLLWPAAGFRVLVVDVFSRSAWWRFPGDPSASNGLARASTEMPSDLISTTRSAEEALMARLTGAMLQNLDLPEALLRGHSIDGVFTANAGPADEQVISSLEQTVAELAARYPQAHWLLPLAIGNHLDHRIARDATWHALRRALGESPSGQSHRIAKINFYEDLPYAADLNRRSLEKTIAIQIKHLIPERSLGPVEYRLADALPWKLEMLRVYWSQFTWPRIERLGEYARNISRNGSCERMWTMPQ